ncbi:MAG: hypothetical protein IJB31_08905 [Akkermansia sp.]|nr:hypothetical protein [Akkermansia sp.]
MNSLTLFPFLTVGLVLTGTVAFGKAPKAVLHDEVIKTPAITYPLPKGWKGFGNVQWDTAAEHPANVCVRTMVLDNAAQNIKAHYISAYEIPIRHITTDAGELAKLLEPAVRNLPGYTLHPKQSNSLLMHATEDVREFRLGRDRIRKALGNDVDGEVYLLSSSYAATHTDPETGEKRPCSVLCGAIVHERSLEQNGRKKTTASFHDIFIIAAPAIADPEREGSPVSEALSNLRRTMKQPDINREWMHAHIRTMANAMDGMPKVDTKAINRMGEKAKEGISTGLPTVLGTLEATAVPQPENTAKAAENEKR